MIVHSLVNQFKNDSMYVDLVDWTPVMKTEEFSISKVVSSQLVHSIVKTL